MENNNEKTEQKVNKILKTSKIITTINCIVLSLTICFNIYYNLFYYKPTKRKLDKSNLFNGNSISVSEDEVKNICTDLEKKLEIEIDEEQVDEYLILDAINKNDDFGEYKWYYSDKLIQIFMDNPYLDKETVYENLLNVEIIYKKRPFFINKNILGLYSGEKYNSIGVFTKYPDLPVSLHEIIHCIFDSSIQENLPRFFVEGMTELLTNEYACGNYIDVFAETSSYPFEVAAVKMLCEVTSSDTVLKAFTYGDMNYIIDEMNKLYRNKEEVKKAIQMMSEVLDCYSDDKKHNYTTNDFYKECILVFQDCIDNKYKDKEEETISYYYNEMLFYNCLFNENALSRYIKDLDKYGVDFKVYFSSSLKNEIENGRYEYIEGKNINNKQFSIGGIYN